MSRSNVLWWVGVVLVVAGVGLYLGRGRSSGPPLDPTSTDPLGTRALVELLESFDAEVTRRPPVPPGAGGPADPVDTAVLLQDELDDATRERLLGWVRAGGVLVLADPSSPVGRGRLAATVEGPLDAGTCTIDALGGLRRVDADALLLFTVRPGEESCFGTGTEAWLVARSEGAGSIVTLGGAAPLVNENLDEGDNAAVVTSLLAPRPGTRVAVIHDPVAGPAGADGGSGTATLADLVPDRVWWAFGQLGVAFALYLLWRARRFGRPVSEPQVVALPGSLLVRARGDLYRRSRSHERVAAELRRDAERRIRRHLGLTPEAPLPVAELAARTGRPDHEVERLLVRPPPSRRARDVEALAVELDRLLEPLEPRDALDARGPLEPESPDRSGVPR